MKGLRIVIAVFFATSLFTASAIAEEGCCDKNVVFFDPSPGSYTQISPDEANEVTNFTFSNQKEACVTLERIGDKEKTKERN